MRCHRCESEVHDWRRLFCEACGALLDRDALRTVRLAGPIGVAHSTSPAIEEFWATGDPDVFDDPTKRGRHAQPQ